MNSPACSLCTNGRVAVFFFLLACSSISAQTVENVRTTFDQSKQLVYIHYELKGLNYKKEANIIPYTETGSAALVPMQSLSGDFGWVSRGGKGKVITWDPFKDGVNSLEGIRYKIMVSEVRNADIAGFWGLMLHGSNSAPFGAKFIQLSRTGFYAGFRMGKLPPSNTYTVSDNGYMDYSESGVYAIGNKKRLAGYAITAGPAFQVSRNLYTYAGAGFGVEQLFWEYQAFDLEKRSTGNEWALNETINSKGIAVDAGVVLRHGRFLVDLGGSTIQFKSFQITGGIGWAFDNKK